MTALTNEQRFAALFRGLERAHAVSRPTSHVSAAGKREAQYRNVKTPVTPAAWERHMAGKEGLVITPIRDDGGVYFGAIDVDVYPLDATELLARITALSLPLVACRTKSGGAHLYLFLRELTDATRVRVALQSWARALGHPGVEIFPKQVKLASENDFGSGINLPYFGGARAAFDATGELDLATFLDRAEAARATVDQLTVLEAPSSDLPEPEDLRGAPPCLLKWAAEGVPEGRRNETMFDFAVYCRKRYGDDWRDRFEELNRAYCSPPLAAQELLAIYKSVAGRTYTYKCRGQGDFCDKAACRKAEYGMGGGYDEPQFEVGDVVLVLTDPKQVIITINGKNVEFAMPDLLDQRRFQGVVWEAIELIPKPVKAAKWPPLVEGWLARAERVHAPEDASEEGQLLQHVEGYRRHYPARELDELRLDGRAYYDPEQGRLYFKSRDLLAYLKRERVTGWSAQALYQAIRKLGGGQEKLDLAGETVTAWWLPAEPESREPIGAKVDNGGDEVPF